MRVGAIVTTLNEEARIDDCLKQLKPDVSHLLVLDDESTDRTVEFARVTADKVVVKHIGPVAPARNYAMSLMPKWCEWLLICDADERFDPLWTSVLKKAEAELLAVNCFRFPRLNLPKPDLTYPDYQVRFFRNNPDYEWRDEGGFKDILYSKSANKRADQLEGVTTLDYCPILHLPRRTDLRRPWW